MKKNYVLDTNILLSSPNAIFGFADNNVFITATTLQELDKKKTSPGEVGFNARRVNHILDELCMHSKELKTTGTIPLNHEGGTLAFLTGYNETLLPKEFSCEVADNRIIAACKQLSTNTPNVFLVTNDVSMRTNAMICGVEVQEYKNDHIVDSEIAAYKGYRIVEVNASLMKKAANIATETIDPIDYGITEPLTENEFVLITNKARESKAYFIHKNGLLEKIPEGKTRAFGVKPMNDLQAFALYALTAPVEEIPLVIISGPAGSSKTFLSLAAGLDQTYDSKFEQKYNKVLISRNNVCADADFGYLPGDMEDKMMPLLAPFYDNLETLLSINVHTDNKVGLQTEIQMQIDDMFADKIIDICPLAYMRGRSITNSFLIVDEIQNATKSLVRDIITRAGNGTKIVLCGDPSQIDNHLLDKINNGLVYAADKMKGSPLCAQITFDEGSSVRSPLVKDAIVRLTL